MKPIRLLPVLPYMRLKLMAAFGSALLVLVVAAIGLIAVDRHEAAQRWVDHGIEMRRHLRNLIETMLEAHVAQASYLMFGDTDQLAAARRLREKVESDLSALTQISFEPEQRARIASLAPFLEQQVSALEEAARMVAQNDRAVVLEFVRKHHERFDYEQVMNALRGVRTAEEVLISERKSVSIDTLDTTRILLVVGSAFAFLLATFVITRIRKSVIEIGGAHSTIAIQARELSRRTRELERTVKELDQFAYVASHDLKAPLRGITTLAQWLQEDTKDRLDDQGIEHLRLMQVRVARMEALVDGVLAYARAGRGALAVEPIDMAALVRDVIDLVAHVPGTSAVTIEGALPTIRCVRSAIQQVWLNLIGNAIKHGAVENAVIKVGARQEFAETVYYVSDNGPGIEGKFHDRIFGLFQTLASRDKIESTGIGLAIVKKLVEQQGGSVWVDSEPGKGTTFSFTYPPSNEGPALEAGAATRADKQRERNAPTYPGL